MNIYNNWGFFQNPFDTKPLPADDYGKMLLIDRIEEVKSIKLQLSSSSNILTIEGDNGIGKTSLINVASYSLYNEFLENGEGDLFVPCDSRFQLDPDKNVEDLVDEVLMSVAQTLLRRGHDLLEYGHKLVDANAINKWLNYPIVKSYNGQFNVALFGGVGGGSSSTVNTSIGYLRSGFRIKILDWLREIFPYGTNGGVVCVIDNLELLQTSAAAKRQLERLRDTLLNYTGLKWVLCGSSGIVLGVASSPRLKGRLSTPIVVNPITTTYASDIFSSRISAFKLDDREIYLPLSNSDFVKLYKLLNCNIRNVLNYIDNYCLAVAGEKSCPKSVDEKSKRFCLWLDNQSVNKVESIKMQIKPTAFQLFKRGIDIGGEFSPGDYEKFGFESLSAMRPHIALLEEIGLVACTIDETDKRRKTIQITPEGWFFNYGLSVKS